jgi:hypothetical protein
MSRCSWPAGWWTGGAPVPARCAQILVLCGCAFVAGGCGGRAGIRESAGLAPASVPESTAFEYAAQVQRLGAGAADSAQDSVRVIGIARNISDRTLDLCCRFDFGGGYKPCPECPRPERPPTLYLLPASWRTETPFEGQRTRLAPGGEFRDTLVVTFRALDFEYAPGKITIEGSFWIGEPGRTFAQATCLEAEAFRVAVEVP